MPVTVTQNKVVQTIPPVSITVDTLPELELLRDAMSKALLAQEDEESAKAVFFSHVASVLDEYGMRYRKAVQSGIAQLGSERRRTQGDIGSPSPPHSLSKLNATRLPDI